MAPVVELPEILTVAQLAAYLARDYHDLVKEVARGMVPGATCVRGRWFVSRDAFFRAKAGPFRARCKISTRGLLPR